MNLTQLPLFPLQVVLLPHAALPLHIFEDRYKLMIQRCIRESSEFGIVLVRDQSFATIGCAAGITNVTKTYDDGRMDVLVEGRERFRVTEVHTTTAPYAIAEVEFFTDDEPMADPALVRETVALYNAVVHIVYSGQVRELDPEAVMPGVAFVMAQKAGLDIEQRQTILELRSERDRLEMLRGYLVGVLPRLKKFEEVERIIRSDGYLQ
jgi:Lon protease-like protein